jgi:hypothetical protein
VRSTCRICGGSARDPERDGITLSWYGGSARDPERDDITLAWYGGIPSVTASH